MPTIKTVCVHYQRKFNLGNYESAAIGIDIWADVTEEEDLAAAMRRLWTMAKANVKTQALPLTAKHRAKVEEAFLGLPEELKEAVIASTE